MEVIVPDTVVTKKETEISKLTQAPVKEDYDSLVNQRLFVFQHVDSLTKEIRKLETENNSLSDSLTYYKFMNNQLKSYIQITQQPASTKDKKNKRKKSKTEIAIDAALKNN